jgi:glutathione S-transferase
MSMILRYSPASPYARKVRIAMAVLGLESEIDLVAADTTDPADSLRHQAPLGKIPALILEDGTALYDSRVILDYLDDRCGGGRLIPLVSAERYRALALAALGDGVLDASLLQVYEHRFRPEAFRYPDALAYQAEKVARSLKALEATPPAVTPCHVGQIGLACALGYLDLRFEGHWRESHPRLVGWLGAFAAAVPAFEATRFKPA